MFSWMDIYNSFGIVWTNVQPLFVFTRMPMFTK